MTTDTVSKTKFENLEDAAKSLKWARKTASAVEKTNKAATAYMKEHLPVGEDAHGYSHVQATGKTVDMSAASRATRQRFMALQDELKALKDLYTVTVPTYTQIRETK